MVSDHCLAKGRKRKLSQVTLLQLNFSRSKIKVDSSQTVDKGNQVIPSEPYTMRPHHDAVHNSNELDSLEEYDNNHHSIYLTNNELVNCTENPVSEDIANSKFASPPLPLDFEAPGYDLEGPLDNCDISKVLIPTFIVGRRYLSREELDPESRIFLSRDPENVKDPNAIKVQF